MKWKNRKKWYQYLGLVLTVILIAGSLLGLRMAEPIEPENTIVTEVEKMSMEVMEGNGTGKFQNSGEMQTEKTEQEEPEKEEEPEEETKEEEEQEEDTKLEQGTELKEESEPEQETEPEEKEEKEEEEEREPEEESESEEEPEPEEESEPEEEIEPEEESEPEEETESEEEKEPGTEEEKNEEDAENEDTDDNAEEENPIEDEPGDENAGLVTDLQSKIITFSELENDTLNFYAYYSDATVNADIRVNYKHETETGNGTWLAASGRDYSCVLTLGKNVITIYYSNAGGERQYASFAITYQADKATEDIPEVGEKPPVITTNLDTWTGEISTQNFTFTVSAKTGTGDQIYSNHIQVQMDGQTITNPTGNSTYEYVLYFPKPVSGETEEHKITVLAWDDAGNSKLVTYQVTYRSADVGEVIGQVRVVVDATTVGVGILADENVDIIQGKPASYTLMAALEQMSFEYEFAGTEMIGFYIRSVTRGNAFKNAAIPEDLLAMIQKDEIEMREPCTKNRLGEYDFTQGSGWLYSVNGGNYAGKGLSEWYLNDGDTLYMRFTLAYGKDIGGSDSEFGRLNSYCGMWIDGGYIPMEHAYVETKVEPTETEAGYIEYCCSNCLHSYREEWSGENNEEETNISNHNDNDFFDTRYGNKCREYRVKRNDSRNSTRFENNIRLIRKVCTVR